ncbi:hypothetical protein, partial [Pseudonocardia oceani]|uniref:hypothetical protein n=1 Tax=Pseudonocardia oceani TaxID=2792013 RepID=UPI001C49EF52
AGGREQREVGAQLVAPGAHGVGEAVGHGGQGGRAGTGAGPNGRTVCDRERPLPRLRLTAPPVKEPA